MKSTFTSILFLFCLSSFSKNLEQNTIKEGPIGMIVNELNLRIKTATKPLLVYFLANWCVVCKRQKPVLTKVLCEMFFLPLSHVEQ